LPISAIFDTVFWAFLWSRSQVYSLNIRKKRASWLLAEKCSQCHIMGASSSINSLTTLRPYIAAALIGREP